jgi:dTDP-4-amino-4,6-dideoxygalactose transaminase
VLKEHFAARDVLLTDSGTGALTLAIKASLAGRPGAAVALPAYGCYDLATAADGAGAPVVLYDLDPATLSPDIVSLRRALAHDVGAVVLVHLYGIPADPEPVRAVLAGASKAGAAAVLIEDAAQGAGARLRGRPLGSFGDLVVLSFGRGKGITAGRGGALLARHARAAALVDSVRRDVLPPRCGFRELVQLKMQWLFGRPWLYAVPSALPFLRLGETVYHSPSPVRGLSAVAARALASTWPLAWPEGACRRAHATRLLARSGAGLSAIRSLPNAEWGHLRLPFLASPAARAAAGATPARALGVMPGYLKPLCDLTNFVERVANRRDHFSGARILANRLLTFPVHRRVSESDMAALESWLVSTLG